MLSFCVLSGCEKKKNQQDLLFLSTEGTIRAEDAKIENFGSEELQTGESQTDQGTDRNTTFAERVEETSEKEIYVVHICGAVRNPGVYQMDAGSRVYQVIDEAGGLCEDAAGDYLNQADTLRDGMKIYVPTQAEAEESGGNNWQSKIEPVTEEETRLVNINTANEELLCTIPGVGSSRAKSIIAYREKNGAFQKIEDIMNVEGIKEGLFQKIRDSITV